MKAVTDPARPEVIVVASADAKLVRRLTKALTADAGLELAAVEADATAAVTAAVRYKAAVCLVDDALDGGSLAATAKLAARRPEAKVVVLTADPRPSALRAHVRAGVAGYLPRTMNLERLPHVILAVLGGSVAFPRGLMSALVADFRDSAPRRRPTAETDLGGVLTGREWEIFDLLRQGRTTREIAARLFISTVTVRTHTASILRKLELPNRASIGLAEQRLGRGDHSLARAS